MFEQFTKEEVETLKKIADNPIFKKSQPFHVTKLTSLDELKINICHFYDITQELFLSNRKDAILVQARKEFVHHAVKIKRVSTETIAKAMNRDHSTVCYYLKKASPETDKLLQSFNDSGEDDN